MSDPGQPRDLHSRIDAQLTERIEEAIDFVCLDALVASRRARHLAHPVADSTEDRAEFEAGQRERLTAMGVLDADGVVDASVAGWIRAVCRPAQWLELRFVAQDGSMLRGLVARNGTETVVALRRAYRTVFRSGRPRQEALAAARAEGEGVAEVERFLRFIESSKRGVAAHGRG